MSNNNEQNFERMKNYMITGFGLFVIYIVLMGVFYAFQENIPEKSVWPFLFIFFQFFLSTSFAGFFGYCVFLLVSSNTSKTQEKVKILIDPIKENFPILDDEKSNTNEISLSLNKPITNLINHLNAEDEQSKLLNRKSRRLKANNHKIVLYNNDEFIKPSKLHFISDFLYELNDYAKNYTPQNTLVAEKNALDEVRFSFRQIEALLTVKRAKTVCLFCCCPAFIFFIVNIIALVVLRALDCYKGPIHNYYLNSGFLITTIFIVLTIPAGYYFYAKFKHSSVKRWRKGITKIEDIIAQFYELFFFFFGIMLSVGLCFGLLHIFNLNFTSNEKHLFFTLISAFFPLELFKDFNSEHSLLQNTGLVGIGNNMQVIDFIVRFLSIILTTIFSLKIVNLIVNKYRKYSYDEHSYNAFLPPELAKIFGYFSVFIISSALAYSLVVAEIKETTLKNQPSNGEEPIAITDKSFSFTDFLPYSIFITLIGAGLAIATRDLLDNYFAGVAQKVDPPFEEGDMVTVGDSSIMQVQTIGFKSVGFYEINKNAIRHTTFKSLEKQRITNYTDPTLHYRRTIHLHVSVMNQGKNELKDLPVTQRAEMLLLLAAFYVKGVLVPTQYFLKSNQIRDIKDTLRTNLLSKDISKDTCIIEINKRITKKYNINKEEPVQEQGWKENIKEEEQKIQEEQKNDSDTYQQENKKLFLNKLVSTFKSDNIKEIPKYYDELDFRQESLEKIHRLKNDVLNIEKEIAFIKLYEELIKDNSIKQNKSVSNLKEEYDKTLIKAASLAVDISYKYYQLALLLWEQKEQKEISKFEQRNIDEASLELLKAPRVSSKNIIDANGTSRWQMNLEVTLQLAEQSDEVIHHVNSFVDKHYQRFIGTHETNNNDDYKK